MLTDTFNRFSSADAVWLCYFVSGWCYVVCQYAVDVRCVGLVNVQCKGVQHRPVKGLHQKHDDWLISLVIAHVGSAG